MRPVQRRALQGGVLAFLLLLVVAVAVSLKRPTLAPASPAPVGEPITVSNASRMGGVVFRKLDAEGNERFLLEAERLEGQEQEEVRLSGVRMRFPYKYQGQTANATIASRNARYAQNGERAVFEGEVKVRTDDGFELETDSLTYRGDRGTARTESPFTFRRKDVSGSGTGAIYRSEEGLLEILADVAVRVDGDDSPPLEIRSIEGKLDRAEGMAHFVGEVRVVQGADNLDAASLDVAFSEDQRALAAFSAMGNAVLRMSAGTELPGLNVTGAGKGSRVLKGQRIDATMRPGRKLEAVTAGPEAELTVMPGAGEARQRRQVFGRFLTFRFDEEGRLSEMHGQKDVVVLLQPLAPARGEAQKLSCRSLLARFDPATGAILDIAFSNQVVISEGTKRATADRGWYEGPSELLVLDQDPEITDTADHSQLVAREIRVSGQNGQVTANGDIRHVLGQAASVKRQDLLGGAETPTVVTCGRLFHDPQKDTTDYEGGTVLRSGKDETRAVTIRVEGKAGERRLRAAESVVSLFNPKATPGKKAPETVEIRSHEMSYDETAGRAVYGGDVVIRQGDLLSKSPQATLDLTEDGKSVSRVVAGEPVEIQQGPRRATGHQATYTPSDEILVVVGDKAVLREPNQEVLGRSLTFRVREQRVLVDGLELGRTETILKKEPSVRER